MIPNELIRNELISPDCRWLIIYLLSNVGEWIIRPKQIVTHLKGMMGKSAVYNLIKEAVDHGYLRREVKSVGNLRNHVGYFVSASPISVSQFSCHENRDPENSDSQEEHLKEYSYKNHETSLKVSCETVAAEAAEMEVADASKVKPVRKSADFTPQVKELAANMVDTLIKHEPEYTPPKNLAAFMTEVDYMIRLDKREPDKIVEVLNWALADSFWKDKLFKPNPAKYLREKYLQLKNKMEAPPPKVERKFAPSSDYNAALNKLKEMNKRAL
jgi:hypothetical protein